MTRGPAGTSVRASRRVAASHRLNSEGLQNGASPALAKEYNRGWREPTGTGSRTVVTVKVVDRVEVDRIHAKLAALGHRTSQPPFDTLWCARYAIVEDPDGTHVGIMSASDPARRSAPPNI